MSNDSIERFKFIANGYHVADARMRSNPDGEWTRYLDHQRIVGALKAQLPVDTPCKWCNDGDTPKLLDCDGTLITITGKPGVLCHAYDVYWWPCLRFGAELRTQPQPSLSDAIKEVEKMRDEWDSIPTEGHDVHVDGYHYGQTCKDAAIQVIERLKSLGPQGED